MGFIPLIPLVHFPLVRFAHFDKMDGSGIEYTGIPPI